MVAGLLTLVVLFVSLSILGLFIRADGHLHLHDKPGASSPP